MTESGDFAGTQKLDYERWRDFIRSEHGVVPKVSEPDAFACWMRPLNLCGFAAVAIEIQCQNWNISRVERTHRDVRRAGLEDYQVVFQVAGRSAAIQNDQAVELARGDVILDDLSRPLALANNRSGQWLSLRLPRQPLISHFGFEPQGGLYGRGGALPTRLLYQIVQDAIEEEESLSAPASAYMQLAVYDLLGALFAPSDLTAVSRHTDKLFARICGIIKDRFADPELDLDEVAAKAGISLRYVQKLFTARGLTCNHFIYSLRLDHAERLLQRRASLKTGQPLSEIAYACGFHDYSYFARKFRHRFGCLPTAYAAGHGRSSGI